MVSLYYNSSSLRFGQVFNQAHLTCFLVSELSLHDVIVGDSFAFF